MRTIAYGSIDKAQVTEKRCRRRGEIVTEQRWTVGHAMLMAVLAGLALWSAFGAAVYWVLA